MRTLTAEIVIRELETRETYTFTVTDGKVIPPKGCFVTTDGNRIVLGFGVKIDQQRIKETP